MKQKTRSYNLLCPISRTLDHVGDRWTLLILRDLHAGPARFKDLQTGLTGIASNLLSDRLNALESSGLIQKYESEFGVSLYSLTELGEETGPLIFELARFGGRMPRPAKSRRPGNLRTVAVSLGTAIKRAVGPEHDFEATLMIDGEAFRMTARKGSAEVRAGAAEAPDVVMTTSYDPIMALADGEIEQSQFFSEHVALDVNTPGKEAEFFDLLSRSMREFD
ncbi:putative HTH-type transcriptional regulator YybR [Shimia sp. SK013]|uniref:winged helix-turn-helix transcriptional regulator n=1 Tax=Shimia sp. SK013 TaxID=1389006 RepID=UPI0006B62AEC|nr:helix-turn-helix domain-containing protein [Shimia sp. SK013]KPA21128.1 putative HTH-type transcriptional regulator YybR [Shimia sp. SK013]